MIDFFTFHKNKEKTANRDTKPYNEKEYRPQQQMGKWISDSLVYGKPKLEEKGGKSCI